MTKIDMSLVCTPAQRRLPPAMNVTNAEKVLKNYCKAKGYEKPVYRITSRGSTMLDGEVYRFKHYVCAVSVSGFKLAEGEGFSKRIARKKAAMDSLAQLRVLELQDFWEVYQTILPASSQQLQQQQQSQLTDQQKRKQMMITASSVVEIEELMPTGGIMTPAQRKTNSTQQQQPQQQQQQEEVETAEVELRARPDRERTLSADSSNLLISAAIEKLKGYVNDADDDAGWKRKEEEAEEEKAAKRKKATMFSDEEMHLFNERSVVGDTDLRDIIVEAAHEIEVIEESGLDDFDL